jgi:pyruvate formate lyase activating enzyme
MAETDIRIGGFTPLTSIDYPDELAAVLFCLGCPWRCAYCQNPELILHSSSHQIPWGEILEFLERRRGLLDAVVFSGGEPTLQGGLVDALRQVRAMGFKTGLHTAGPYPQRLDAALELLDWVAQDIKAPRRRYARITGVDTSGEKAWESARLIIDSGVAHEFRTTVHPSLLSPEDVDLIASDLKALGARSFVVQECVTEHCLHAGLRHPIDPDYLQTLSQRDYASRFERFSLRLR